MAELEKDRAKQQMYKVVNNSESLGVHKREVGDLKHLLETATDRNTGYKTWKSGDDKLEVEAREDSVTLRSRYDNGSIDTMKMSYRAARDLIGSIEDRIVKEAIVEEELKKRQG